jgi:outer membrane protein assembly factor BamB
MNPMAIGPLSDATRRRRADAPLAPPLRAVPERTLSGVAFPPVVAGEQAVLALRSGELVALDVATGARRWSVRSPGAVEAGTPGR